MGQETTTPRNVQWIGDSKERLQTFPEPVRKDIGHALYRVQIGETPPSAKPMKGIESGVFELVDTYGTDTYRAVYTVKIGRSMYVLHCFQKKSKSYFATPPRSKALAACKHRVAPLQFYRASQGA